MTQVVKQGGVNFDSIHKLPRNWRYFNISVLWIFYYQSVLRFLYRLRVRHEIVTTASILTGLAAAAMILRARSATGFIVAATLVHLKDIFDACDGALARLTGTGHRLGRFLDTIGDGVVFTAWIAACAIRAYEGGLSLFAACTWGVATWLSLFLQCSYFNFHQLHYVRLSGESAASRLDERSEIGHGFVGVLAKVYDVWFGWQDRLLARWDSWQKNANGSPSDDDWYGRRSFMVANSALCFGTHAFVLILCLLCHSPIWFLPAVSIGMNLYWGGIVLTRLVVFRRAV